MAARRASRRSRVWRVGFSLLEVMVAIAILGLTLTVILSSQGGLSASNRSAANMGVAITMGRCRMTEIEEKLLKLGYQETDQIETGVACCDDELDPRFTCDWKVEKVELPNMTAGNTLGDGGSMLGAPAMTGLVNPAGSGASLDLSGDGGLQAMGNQVAGQFGMGSGSAGAAGMLSMVMSFIYPSIKPMFEASIRRVTVTVKWKEGPNERELPLVQYVTNPQRGGFAGSALLPDGGPMDFAPAAGATGVPGATATPVPAPAAGGLR